jgi:DNA-binding phage protein
MANAGHGVAAIAKSLGCSRMHVYRVLASEREEQGGGPLILTGS